MRRVTLITGGASSGKSGYAVERAKACGPDVLFVATCVPRDEEMRAKIDRHRAERPRTWRTVEAGDAVAKALELDVDATIVDCLTLFVSEKMLAGASEADVLGEVSRLCEAATGPLFLVTNEVGAGIVPENALARRFREVAGHVNRRAAQLADEVVIMVAGIPLTLKGQPWKP